MIWESFVLCLPLQSYLLKTFPLQIQGQTECWGLLSDLWHILFCLPRTTSLSFIFLFLDYSLFLYLVHPFGFNFECHGLLHEALSDPSHRQTGRELVSHQRDSPEYCIYPNHNVKGTTDRNHPPWPGTIVITCMSYLTAEGRTSYHQPEEFGKGQKERGDTSP